ncbi:MAG TPA: Rv0909 family putative TA system antitoxin [Acidimicrobiales bacterium]|nr:Rv0909 family putative TA system antitoxin [Acidimicrobiales bacterium]
MADFEKLEEEAKQAAQGHSQQVDEGISKGEQEIDQRVGQDHASQVQQAGDALEKELGTLQAPQAPQPPQPPDQQ